MVSSGLLRESAPVNRVRPHADCGVGSAAAAIRDAFRVGFSWVQPMRVLVVTNMYPSVDNPVDGIFIRRQIDALVANNPTLQIHVCYVDTVRRKTRYLSGIKRVWDEFNAFRPDLLHIHYGLSQLLCCTLPHKPTLVTFHGSDLTIPWQRRISQLLLRRSSRVVVVTSRLLAYLPVLRDAAVVPCGVDTARFNIDRNDARTKLGIDPADQVVLFGSHPDREVKRYDRFLAVSRLMGEASKRVRVMRLSDVPMHGVPALIVAADILVMTSDREGSPVVTKEALCAGTRVVSTPVGDVAEQFSGLSGCAVAGWDVAELAASALRLLDGPAPDRSIAARRFDVAREASALMAIYRSMVRS